MRSSAKRSIRATLDPLKDIRARLETLRIGGPCVLDEILDEVRRFLNVEAILVYRPGRGETGWNPERLHISGDPAPTLTDRLAHFLETPDEHPGAFDPTPPGKKRAHRLNGVWLVDRRADEGHRHEEHAPLRLEPLQKPGIVHCDCEASSRLAWLGVLHSEPVDAQQREILSAVASALTRRLSAERRIQDGSRAFAAPEFTLERLEAPAFVVDADGRIHEANRAARKWMEQDASETRRALKMAVQGHPSEPRFEILPLIGSGAALALAIVSEKPEDAGMVGRESDIVASWRLTRRQSEVLELVVRGVSNAGIARALHITGRTVEFHVSRLFERAGVESRACLIAAVFSGR